MSIPHRPCTCRNCTDLRTVECVNALADRDPAALAELEAAAEALTTTRWGPSQTTNLARLRTALSAFKNQQS